MMLVVLFAVSAAKLMVELIDSDKAVLGLGGDGDLVGFFDDGFFDSFEDVSFPAMYLLASLLIYRQD